ncbi:MAG TPA: polyprenol phosphomannose-dependent alpha 1,6 mannosyltransferase MptB [Solirubrobacteraceae bacterium]|nr:polyprenol phosphomannose-dependent alpha 1,6 mannosyltransferase MptB [Solirubrobacteraceae bacterium]
MPVPRRSTRLAACATLGLAGSLLAAVAAPRALENRHAGWWYGQIATSRGWATVLVWAGMVLLALAWLGVLRLGPGRRAAYALTALWALPLVAAPPLFSSDVYSYLAQGTILHLGHDPYTQPPTILAGLGHRHLLDAVSKFWRHTTAPYGPLFLELVGLISTVGAVHIVAGVLLCRALDLIGLVLLAIWIPRLADALGADRGRALWLVLASPLMLLGLVAPAHNDLLMAGLLAAGVGWALRGRPLLGVAICALAATIKLPALVAVAFIAVAWGRSEQAGARRLLVAQCAGIAVVVLGLVTVVSGVGVGWLSSSVFSTPARVHLAITPATAIGETVALVLHGAGVAVSAHGLESALGVVATALAAVVGLRLLWLADVPRVAVLLGATLLLAAICGPAAWPWYLSWGFVLVAAAPAPQRSPALLVALALGAFLVRPDGVLALPIESSPGVLVVYAAALEAWRRVRRRRAPGPAPAISSAPVGS